MYSFFHRKLLTKRYPPQTTQKSKPNEYHNLTGLQGLLFKPMKKNTKKVGLTLLRYLFYNRTPPQTATRLVKNIIKPSYSNKILTLLP